MTYREVSCEGKDLKEVVVYLVSLAAEGELVCTNYQGTMLYSDKVSLNSAFMNILGKSYQSYLEKTHKQSDSSADLDETSITQTLLGRGKQIIDSQFYSTWEKYVLKYVSKQGFIEIFNYALKILALVNKGCMSEAATTYNSCPAAYHKNICLLVEKCSAYGENFVARVVSAQNIYNDTGITGSTEYFKK